MRIILFGTGPFAVPTFTSLVESDHEVVALVTRPILDSGKRRKESENPVRDLCQSYGFPIYDPSSVNEPPFIEQLSELQADLFVVCDFGQILSRPCLSAASKGGINLHGSLLPKYRGAAPIHWAIYHGEIETGVTVFLLTPALDGGPVLTTATLPIGPMETTGDIETKLSQLSIEPVHRAIQMLGPWDGKSPIGTPQDRRLATKAPRLSKSDGQVDWSRSADPIVNQIRAFQPWPGSWTRWLDPSSNQSHRLIIHRAQAVGDCVQAVGEQEVTEPLDQAARESLGESLGESLSESLDARLPGEVAIVDKKRLWVKTGNGLLAVLEVQPAGKRKMDITEFLRGHSLEAGQRFESN